MLSYQRVHVPMNRLCLTKTVTCKIPQIHWLIFQNCLFGVALGHLWTYPKHWGSQASEEPEPWFLNLRICRLTYMSYDCHMIVICKYYYISLYYMSLYPLISRTKTMQQIIDSYSLRFKNSSNVVVFVNQPGTEHELCTSIFPCVAGVA